MAGVSLPVARLADRGEILGLRAESMLRVAGALGVTVAECWPILGPLPKPAARARDTTLAAGLAELDEKRKRARFP
jgi:hypothetical protein